MNQEMDLFERRSRGISFEKRPRRVIDLLKSTLELGCPAASKRAQLPFEIVRASAPPGRGVNR